MSRRSGFTLVECAVCCAIVCTMCCLSVPAYTSMKSRAVFRAEVQGLISVFYSSRQAAIKLDCPVILQFLDNEYTVFVDEDASSDHGDWEKQDDDTVLVENVMPKGLSMTTTFTLGRTRFQGVPNVKAGSVILSDDNNGQRVKVIMNIAGRIRTQNI